MKILPTGLEIRIPISGVMYCLPPFPRCLLHPCASHTEEGSGGGEKNKVLVVGAVPQWQLPWPLGNGDGTGPHPKLGSWCLDSSHLLSDPFSISASAWSIPPRALSLPTTLCVPRVSPFQRTCPPTGPSITSTSCFIVTSHPLPSSLTQPPCPMPGLQALNTQALAARLHHMGDAQG